MTPFIESLGERQYLSPLRRAGPGVVKFKTDRDQILCEAIQSFLIRLHALSDG